MSEELTLEEEKDFVKVNENYQTSLNWVYAAGDIITRAATNTFSSTTICAVKPWRACLLQKLFPLSLPAYIPSPAIAIVGITEEIAAEQGVIE